MQSLLRPVAAMQEICSPLAAWGGGERRDGFVTGSAGLSGKALSDEPRLQKNKI